MPDKNKLYLAYYSQMINGHYTTSRFLLVEKRKDRAYDKAKRIVNEIDQDDKETGSDRETELKHVTLFNIAKNLNIKDRKNFSLEVTVRQRSS